MTALDVVCAQSQTGAVARSRQPVHDYSDRRGMPKPPDEMRGAARNFEIPRDMRAPDALRSFTSQNTERPRVAAHSRA